MAPRVRHSIVTGAAANPRVLVDGPAFDADHVITGLDIFGTRTEAEAATIAATANSIRTEGFYVAGDGGGGLYARAGSEPSHTGKIQSADGAWWEIADSEINVCQFGAKKELVGLAATDNTTTINAALSAAQSLGKNLYFPGGRGWTYRTKMIDYGNPVAAEQISIIVDDMTLIQKITSDGNPLLRIGNVAGTRFTQNILVQGGIWSGIAGDTSGAIECYDLIRSRIAVNKVQNSVRGLSLFGGIAVTIDDVTFIDNTIGFSAQSFASAATVGVSNIIVLNRPVIVDNTLLGGYAQGGAQLVVNEGEIEGNGASGNASAGGFYLEQDTPSGVASIFNGCWFESNEGGFDAWANSSGHQVFRECHFDNNALTTYDLRITAGTYCVDNCRSKLTKTINLKEESGVSSGNSITDSLFAVLDYSTTKTLYRSGPTSLVPLLRGGEHTATTSFGLRSTGAAFDTKLASDEVITADRTLKFTLGNANRRLTLSSDITLDATEVKGPASVTDDLPAIFDGTTGKLIKSKTYAAFKTLLALVAGDVGLGNVTNTSDANKPVSTVQQTALDLKLNIAGNQTKTGGFADTSINQGAVSSGTFTPTPLSGNIQHMIANGAFTLAPPSVTGHIDLQVFNSASAGAITTSGFTKVTGTYGTVSGDKYLFRITKLANYSLLEITALQ